MQVVNDFVIRRVADVDEAIGFAERREADLFPLKELDPIFAALVFESRGEYPAALDTIETWPLQPERGRKRTRF